MKETKSAVGLLCRIDHDLRSINTLCLKKTIGYPFYFCNNFFIREQIFIIFAKK